MNGSFQQETPIQERGVIVETFIISGKATTIIRPTRSSFTAEGEFGPEIVQIVNDSVGDPYTFASAQHERIIAEVRDQGLHIAD